MNKIRRTTTNTLYEGYPTNQEFNKSPLRRNTNPHQQNIARSPIRSRTPTRHVSPIKNATENPPFVRYISNVSPIKNKCADFENHGELSNGKSIKYINNFTNDKFYQSNKKDKNQEFNKKSDRIMQDQNRLFGKLVDKLNSEKKNGLKSNQHSYKTSVFVQISDTKKNRMEETITKNEATSKSPLRANREVRTQTKNYERNKEIKVTEEQNLSCLVYKVKNTVLREEQDKKAKKQSVKVLDKNSSANVPSILLKRKVSKNQEENVKGSQILSKNILKNQTEEKEEQDFSELNIFLKKIQQGCKGRPKQVHQDEVKRSLKVQQSLSMDPFL